MLHNKWRMNIIVLEMIWLATGHPGNLTPPKLNGCLNYQFVKRPAWPDRLIQLQWKLVFGYDKWGEAHNNESKHVY